MFLKLFERKGFHI